MKDYKAFARLVRPSTSALPFGPAILITLCAALLIAPTRLVVPARAVGPVHALFDLSTQARGPFPSNLFTVSDPSQNTGLRVAMPKPDCSIRPSDCEDLDLINTLDGFNLLPRLSVPFDGPIDLNSVTSRTVFLIRLGNTMDQLDRGGRVVGINQIVWDPDTNTLHVETDELLDQHTRYALIVTNGVRDAEGRPVEAGQAFSRFRHDLNFGQTEDSDLKNYRKAFLDALQAARAAGTPESDIVSASVFTTLSATATLEKIRDQIKSATPALADFHLGPGGTRTVFPLDMVNSITFNQQRRDNPPSFTPIPLRIDLLRLVPGAVGQIAFGKYVSPDYRIHPGEYIPEVGTRTGTPQVQRTTEIYFNLYLPSGTMPANGWPVAIFGHGSGPNKNTSPANSHPQSVVAKMAEHGIATVMINMAGSGFGPLSTLTANQTSGAPVTFPAGGRSIDQNGDHVIMEGEGRGAASPRSLLGSRDGLRQTAVDLMQLIRVIEVGIDVEGDGHYDLDPSRIYYFGQSLGGHYGNQLLAIEPNVTAGAINHSGGPLADSTRLDRAFRSSVDAALLASRSPSLINTPGVTHINGIAVLPGARFNENIPLRDGVSLTVQLEDGTIHEIMSPLINTVPGAIAIQEFFERREWVTLSGDSVAFVPHLRNDPLAGMPKKSVLLQFAKGDTAGPSVSRVLRAGSLLDRATLFRTDLAVAENPIFLVGAGRLGIPNDPHLLLFVIDNPATAAVALGYQEQIAMFFASNGAVIIHPEPSRFFEVPISLPLPEGIYFIP